MSGASDYLATSVLNFMTGQAAMPALASRYLALFTAAPTSDAGTGGTEVSTSGTGYARQQVAGSAATNAATAAGNATLHFASTPAWLVTGMTVTDLTTPGAIPAGTTITVSGGVVTMSANAAGAGIGNGDSLCFSAWPAASASSGNEPATQPANTTNGAVITFPQVTGPGLTGYGTIVAWGIYDALTGGNLIAWDYLGNFKWLPFTCTAASPGVLTSPASNYTTNSTVAVTAKFGGTLPATAGSWSGLLTVTNISADTFSAGVNTTGTGDGMVRQVLQQNVPTGVTAFFSTSQATLTMA
jgi:hypothetical protein